MICEVPPGALLTESSGAQTILRIPQKLLWNSSRGAAWTRAGGHVVRTAQRDGALAEAARAATRETEAPSKRR